MKQYTDIFKIIFLSFIGFLPSLICLDIKKLIAILAKGLYRAFEEGGWETPV